MPIRYPVLAASLVLSLFSLPSVAQTVVGLPLEGGPTALFSVSGTCECPGVCEGVNLSNGKYQEFQCISPGSDSLEIETGGAIATNLKAQGGA